MRNFKRQGRISGFTLIELLIVIAIILILIAIALPNFLEAKIRATLTQVKAELRTIGIAVESYATDHNTDYPMMKHNRRDDRGGVHTFPALSTPIPYLGKDFLEAGDPFLSSSDRDVNGNILDARNNSHHYSYGYINIDRYRSDRNPPFPPAHSPHFGVFSLGPDKTKGPDAVDGGNWSNGRYGRDPPAPYFDRRFTAWQYSATNGTRSAGDVLHFQ